MAPTAGLRREGGCGNPQALSRPSGRRSPALLETHIPIDPTDEALRVEPTIGLIRSSKRMLLRAPRCENFQTSNTSRVPTAERITFFGISVLAIS